MLTSATGDHTIAEQVDANGVTKEYSVNDGTLTIDVDSKPVVRARNEGVVNFSGDTVKIIGDGTAGGTVNTVFAYDGSSINFNNINTFVSGFSYAGLRLQENSSLTSNNLSLINDRTQDNGDADGGGYGVLINSSSFTANGAADIKLMANKNDGYTYAMYILGTDPYARFKLRAAISADGVGALTSVAALAASGAQIVFEDGADITAKNGLDNTGVQIDGGSLISNGLTKVTVSGSDGADNQGMLSWGASINMGETVIDVSGGDEAGGLEISDSTVAFVGDLNLKAVGNVKAEALDVHSSTFTAGNVSVTAQGDSSARGFYVDDNGSAELSGGLTAFVDGGADGSTALDVQGRFSALFGNITAEGEESEGIYSQAGDVAFTDGVRINAATGIYLQSDDSGKAAVGNFGGYSEVIADKSGKGNTGVQVRRSTLNMADAKISANGGNAAGLVLRGGEASFSGTLAVDASGSQSTGINVREYFNNDDSSGGHLTAKDVSVAVNGQSSAVGFNLEHSRADVDGHLNIDAIGTAARGLMVRSNSSFTGNTAFISVKGENAASTAIFAGDAGNISFAEDVVTDALSTAVAEDKDSSISFAKGLLTLANDTSMTALDGAAISVNSTGAGVVAYTGTTSTESDGTIDMTMNGTNSYWRMTGDSSASTLVNSGALLDMTADGNKFSTLTLANLNGANGIVAMDIDASKNADNSDVILVGDTFSGTQRVSFNRVDSQVDADAAGTVIAKVNNNSGTFIAPADEESSIFYKRYLLDTKASETAGYTTDWYIKELASIDPSVKPTTTVNSVMSAASLNYHTWRTQNDKLMQRMGDLRKGGGANNGAWFRFGGSKISLGGGHGFDNEYMYYEVGYDRIIRETSQYTWFGGVAFSYGEGDSSYSRGDGDNESKAVSLYLTQINKGGSYLDLVFKLGRWDNDFAVYNTYGERITGETESTGISFSAEYGKKIALNKNGFYIEPQAQLTYGHLDGDTYTTSNGVSVHQEGIESLVGRVGFNLGWDISKTSNIYLKASVLHEFLGDYGVSMSDATGRVRLTGDYGDTWFEYGLGAAFKLGKPNSANFLYFDVERSEGGDLDMEWRWNAGFRFEM